MSPGYNSKQIRAYFHNIFIEQNIFKFISNLLEGGGTTSTMLSTGTLHIPDDIMQIPQPVIRRSDSSIATTVVSVWMWYAYYRVTKNESGFLNMY